MLDAVEGGGGDLGCSAAVDDADSGAGNGVALAALAGLSGGGGAALDGVASMDDA